MSKVNVNKEGCIGLDEMRRNAGKKDLEQKRQKYEKEGEKKIKRDVFVVAKEEGGKNKWLLNLVQYEPDYAVQTDIHIMCKHYFSTLAGCIGR